MSFSLFKGNYTLECNSKVNNSSITTSTIDMDGGVITNAGYPTVDTDVANKLYVDSNAGIAINTITLSGTSYTDLLTSILFGDLWVSVKNIIDGGPSGTFQLTKSTASQTAGVTRMSSKRGISSPERIEIDWPPNTVPQIFKTGMNYDGQYKIKYILNE